MTPNSVSIPRIFGIAIGRPYRDGAARRGPRSQILTGRRLLDRAASGRNIVFIPAYECPDVDDSLALLPRDLGPIIGIGGVGKILVFPELTAYGFDQVTGANASVTIGDLAFDRCLFGSAHDVLDHRARREVLEEHHFLITILVGDLEKSVGLI